MLASFAGDVVVVVATLVTEQPHCVHAYDCDARNGAGSMVSNHDAHDSLQSTVLNVLCSNLFTAHGRAGSA